MVSSSWGGWLVNKLPSKFAFNFEYDVFAILYLHDHPSPLIVTNTLVSLSSYLWLCHSVKKTWCVMFLSFMFLIPWTCSFLGLFNRTVSWKDCKITRTETWGTVIFYNTKRFSKKGSTDFYLLKISYSKKWIWWFIDNLFRRNNQSRFILTNFKLFLL